VFIQPDEEPFEDPSAAGGRSTSTPTWPLFFGMISQGRPEPGRDILHGRRTRFPHARKLLAGPEVTIKEIAASLKVNRATIYRAPALICPASGRTTPSYNIIPGPCRALGTKAAASRRARVRPLPPARLSATWSEPARIGDHWNNPIWVVAGVCRSRLDRVRAILRLRRRVASSKAQEEK